jgi:hypothetical protein
MDVLSAAKTVDRTGLGIGVRYAIGILEIVNEVLPDIERGDARKPG